jgi:hypothetical protein
MALSFPIEVSGIDCASKPFCDRTVTNDVSDEGCRFELFRGLRCGDVITIRVVPRSRSEESNTKGLRFEVMWVETTSRGWSIGASKLQPENIWHMSFPKRKIPSDSSR